VQNVKLCQGNLWEVVKNSLQPKSGNVEFFRK